MACNVFGTPVTNETLKGLPAYHDKTELTQTDRATVALNMKNAEGKDANALKFAKDVQATFGETPATLCLIYNATGNPMTLVTAKDYCGHLLRTPYPLALANGQWGAFLHGKYLDGHEYSKGGVVYAGTNAASEERHWCMTWVNNRKKEDYNRVYAEIGDPGKYDSDSSWASIVNILDSQPLMYRYDGANGTLLASIGNDAVAVYEAIMTLPAAFNN